MELVGAGQIANVFTDFLFNALMPASDRCKKAVAQK
jgi:hypothetical protein